MIRPEIGTRIRLIRNPRMVGVVVDRDMTSPRVEALWDDDTDEMVMPEEIEPE